MSFEQDPSEQANISGADLAMLIDELKSAKSQLAAAQGQSLPILQVSAFVEGFLDEVEEPPESNCRCCISPPCNDCVDHSYLRELFSDARRLVNTISELRAAPIPQQPEPSVPEGWKLVPIELTEAMEDAAEKAESRHVIADKKRTGGKDPQLSFKAAYAAMLAAAPQPKEPK